MFIRMMHKQAAFCGVDLWPTRYVESLSYSGAWRNEKPQTDEEI